MRAVHATTSPTQAVLVRRQRLCTGVITETGQRVQVKMPESDYDDIVEDIRSQYDNLSGEVVLVVRTAVAAERLVAESGLTISVDIRTQRGSMSSKQLEIRGVRPLVNRKKGLVNRAIVTAALQI